MTTQRVTSRRPETDNRLGDSDRVGPLVPSTPKDLESCRRLIEARALDKADLEMLTDMVGLLPRPGDAATGLAACREGLRGGERG